MDMCAICGRDLDEFATTISVGTAPMVIPVAALCQKCGVAGLDAFALVREAVVKIADGVKARSIPRGGV